MAGPVHPTQHAARSNIFNIVFFSLAFASWLIALAGLAAVQDNDSSTSGRASVVKYSLDWWTIFYELILLILAVLLVFERPVRLLAYRRPVGDNFIIVTVLLSFMAYNYCTQAYQQENNNGSYARGVKCTAAGVVLLLILNYIWIIVSSSGIVGPRALPSASYTTAAPPAGAYQSPSPVSSPPKGAPVSPMDVEKGSPGQPQVYVISDANPAANGGHRV